MSKHTPGPWAAHHHESTDTYTIHVAGRSWESWAVAHVGDCTQDQANARLIAAAPDLLEELDHIAKTIERQLELITDRAPGDFLDKRPVIQSLQSHARRARAAIAKATGEQ